MLTIHERIEQALAENKKLKKLVEDLLIIRLRMDENKETRAQGLSALASQPPLSATPPSASTAAAAPNSDHPTMRTLTDDEHAILNCMLECIDFELFERRAEDEHWEFSDDERSEVYRLLVTARHIIVGHSK